MAYVSASPQRGEVGWPLAWRRLDTVGRTFPPQPPHREGNRMGQISVLSLGHLLDRFLNPPPRGL